MNFHAQSILLPLLTASLFALTACSNQDDNATSSSSNQAADSSASGASTMTEKDHSNVNPFMSDYDTPFKIPPFERIKNEHYMPAAMAGMEQQMSNVERIVANSDAPTFTNTVEALDASGELLEKVTTVFYGLNSAHTNDEMKAIAKELGPKLSAHGDTILLNTDLFNRIKTVNDNIDDFSLTSEQRYMVTETYKRFARNGANLNDQDKAQLRKINEAMTSLSIAFGQNVLAEDNAFEMVLDSKDDLAGLPENVIAAGEAAAKERGHEGKWVYTLQRASIEPFLQYSERRDLRQKIYDGYIMRGNNDNEFDNKENAAKMSALRVERAQLLGYKTHAHYVLENAMAKTPERVYELINRLWPAALDGAFTPKKSVGQNTRLMKINYAPTLR